MLRAGVGAITETDVLLASASNAIIVGFNVRPDRTAQAVAEQEKVDIRLHSIIYELVDEIKKAMSGMLEPVFKEVYKGRAEVRDVFRISKVGSVAGCMVQDGVISAQQRSSGAARQRAGSYRQDRRAEALQERRQRSEVRLRVRNFARQFNDIKAGDVIEAFATERVAPKPWLKFRVSCPPSASSLSSCGWTTRIPSKTSGITSRA